MMMEELAIAERRILRKILGSIKEEHQYRRRHNNELYKHIEKITDRIRKIRLFFTDIYKKLTVAHSQEEFLNTLEN